MSFNWDNQQIQSTLNSISSVNSIGICDHGLASVSWHSRLWQWMIQCVRTQDTRSNLVIPRIKGLFEALEKDHYWLQLKKDSVKLLIERAEKYDKSDPTVNKIKQIVSSLEQNRISTALPSIRFKPTTYTRLEIKRFALYCNINRYGSRFDIIKKTADEVVNSIPIPEIDAISNEDLRKINQMLHDLKLNLSQENLSEENNKFKICDFSNLRTVHIHLGGSLSDNKGAGRLYQLSSDINMTNLKSIVGGFVISEMNESFKAAAIFPPEIWKYTPDGNTGPDGDYSRTPEGIVLIREIQILDTAPPKGFTRFDEWPKGKFAIPVATIDGFRYIKNAPSIRQHHYEA